MRREEWRAGLGERSYLLGASAGGMEEAEGGQSVPGSRWQRHILQGHRD